MYRYLIDYLIKHPCVDCGEDNILVLEFDHKDPANKLTEVNKLIKNRSTLESLKEEIKKCEVRCANCHRVKTQIESNSWKLRYLRP